jgi:hypothetical protein
MRLLLEKFRELKLEIDPTTMKLASEAAELEELLASIEAIKEETGLYSSLLRQMETAVRERVDVLRDELR